MEQKKSERAARGANAWQPQARQQALDEADRFQVGPDQFACTSMPFRLFALSFSGPHVNAVPFIVTPSV